MLKDYIATLLKSPASLYVILRYVTYALQFLNSLLLVNVLGEFSYGIYGFILMFSVYAIYFNLGLNESLNAEYAINKKDRSITSILWDNTLSFTLLWYCLLIVIAFGVLYFIPNIFSKYEFVDYGTLLIVTCVIHNISTIYATLYKLHGKTLKVNIQQLLPQIGILIIIVLGRNIASINVIVLALFITNLISLAICLVNPPEKFRFRVDFHLMRLLLKRGVSLLLYNLSFQLLTMLALAVVSYLYTVEQMGCYSLANSITNGVIMAGGSFLYIFSPKIINKMGSTHEICNSLIDKFEHIYNIFIDFVSVISIFAVWGLSFLYPSYGDAFVRIYAMLIIGRIINNASTGYSTYLIAIKKETMLVMSGLISLLIAGVCYWLISRYSYSIFTVPLVILIASVLFSSLVVTIGQLNLFKTIRIKGLLRLILGQYKWIIIIMGLIYSYMYTATYVLIIGLLTYLLLNQKNIFKSVKIGFQIVSDKRALKF